MTCCHWGSGFVSGVLWTGTVTGRGTGVGCVPGRGARQVSSPRSRSLTPSLSEIPKCRLFQQFHTTSSTVLQPEQSRWCLFPLPQHLLLHDELKCFNSGWITHKCVSLGREINNWFFFKISCTIKKTDADELIDAIKCCFMLQMQSSHIFKT